MFNSTPTTESAAYRIFKASDEDRRPMKIICANHASGVVQCDHCGVADPERWLAVFDRPHARDGTLTCRICRECLANALATAIPAQ